MERIDFFGGLLLSFISLCYEIHINKLDHFTVDSFPGILVVKNPPCNTGRSQFSPSLGKIPQAAGQLSPHATTNTGPHTLEAWAWQQENPWL